MPLRNERGDVISYSRAKSFRTGNGPRLREQGHEVDGYWTCLFASPLRRRLIVSRGIEWQISRAAHGSGRETVTLFNDRYGMHRLYYHESNDAFYFAAEAKAIIAVRPELRRLDSRGLGEFIACGAVMENRTLFDGIRALPPGSAWIFRKGALESKGSYFVPESGKNQESLDPETYYGNYGRRTRKTCRVISTAKNG